MHDFFYTFNYFSIILYPNNLSRTIEDLATIIEPFPAGSAAKVACLPNEALVEVEVIVAL